MFNLGLLCLAVVIWMEEEKVSSNSYFRRSILEIIWRDPRDQYFRCNSDNFSRSHSFFFIYLSLSNLISNIETLYSKNGSTSYCGNIVYWGDGDGNRKVADCSSISGCDEC